MKILIASSEIIPFASTGGLGDVCAALPKALAKLDVEVLRVMPLYADIDRDKYRLEPCDCELPVPLGDTWYTGTVWRQQFEEVTTYFIQSADFFDRLGLYEHDEGEYTDNFERFLFFQKAVVRMIDEMKLSPDVVHCNDWQTGLIPMLLRFGIGDGARQGREKSLMTVHNLSYQGWAAADKFSLTQLPDTCFTMHTLEYYGELNVLKGGLVAASAINAVSPTYAREIQTPELGCGLDGVLHHRREVLYGILNGVDYDRWNPSTDSYIAAHYSVDDLSGKARCKQALQEQAGLRVDPDAPLIGVITRLVSQKGMDLLGGVMEQMISDGVQLVVLGQGDDDQEEMIRQWAERWPEQVCAWVEFSNEKAHRIEAGSDMFLMPSRFEPCGQNQLYSLRYGTIPLVHGIGGLEDSVTDYAEKEGTGFKFYGFTANNLLHCVERALAVFRDKEEWTVLMQQAMEQDFSVVHMARDYLDLYHTMITGHDRLD